GVKRWDELGFVFFVHAEPRLPLLSLGEPHVTAAYDDEGNSMVPTGAGNHEQPNPQLFGYRNNRPYYGGNRMMTLSGQINLVRPSGKASAVKQIKGTIPATILVEQKAEVVSDKLAEAKGKKIKIGTTTFSVEELSETPTKQPQLRMVITEEAGVLNGPN